MTISVLGCGWLGFPLAQELLKKGFKLKGSTTSKDKLSKISQAGIDPYLIELPKSLNDPKTDSFWNTDILFLNIPPVRGSKHVTTLYPEMIEQIVEKAEEHSVSWIIFASSTSVYSKTGGITIEDDAVAGNASGPTGEALLKAEAILREAQPDCTILRFGGLYGYGRHPVNHLSGRKNLSAPNKPVNLVHQSDCIRAVTDIIDHNKRDEVYNVVSDGHPPRKEFYEDAAEHFNLPKPHFKSEEKIEYRIVSNQKLKKDIGFSFSYTNPMDHTP
jgi:nucleoside-diphosphate-sugar epimerase